MKSRTKIINLEAILMRWNESLNKKEKKIIVSLNR